MPIEDVDFLKKNSKRESYMFLVDSGTRDRRVHPQPSEYVVQFSTPFHNVIGLEVLHASIPRSMYNIDSYNNTLRFFIYEDTQEGRTARLNPNNYTMVTITPGEYSIQTLVAELNRILHMKLNGNASMHEVEIIAETDSTPPELTNKLRFRCTYPFAFDMDKSTSAESLGFDTYAVDSFADLVPPNVTTDQPYLTIRYPSVDLLVDAFQTFWSTMTSSPPTLQINTPFSSQMSFAIYQAVISHLISNDEYSLSFSRDIATPYFENTPRNLFEYLCRDILPKNYRMYRSVDLPPNQALGKETIIFEGPRGVVRSLPLNTTTNRVAQQFTMEDHGFLTQVHAALTTSDGTIRNDSEAKWSLYTNLNNSPHTVIPLQRYNTQNNLVPTEGVIPISLTDGGLSDPAFNVFVELNPGVYWIVFESDNLDTLIFYNDVPATQRQGDMKVYNGVSGNWDSIDTQDGVHFELSIRVIRQDEYHYLTAPGIYSLIGERYIVLRCPEIEENSYRSLAYSGNCLGLAKFQLGVVGYSDNRLDFSKVPTREFHPVGKLQKLTLRFETASGKLYDFKGVNHNITFAIHYYEPNQVQNFSQSILNPNYNGDILKYMYHHDDQEQDSDDQDYEYDQDDLREYRQQEARHLPENVGRLNFEALYRMNQLDLDAEEADFTDDDGSEN